VVIWCLGSDTLHARSPVNGQRACIFLSRTNGIATYPPATVLSIHPDSFRLTVALKDVTSSKMSVPKSYLAILNYTKVLAIATSLIPDCLGPDKATTTVHRPGDPPCFDSGKRFLIPFRLDIAVIANVIVEISIPLLCDGA
jgi:hypothetical protein